ncbi:hypothetical protein K388_03656 [Streptomyces sp. KhCrAH-43]|uniref:hypothetical protein n=1 Tax=unclassified Streptomyces TaxID=2593676 RepID=UPI000372DF27|nr:MULTISPECIES: hypothetical protein [unclassified Streptomyces]RAJ59591.1 hypothetical protein K388_03656 [Streptomyces sp. KhCrAH-43]
MDQHHSRHPQSTTPIYDRLLAEWQAARAAPAPEPTHAGGLVPAARTSDEAAGRG